MSGRHARELPKIDIGGTMFYLDVRLNEFRQCENFMNRINLDDLWDTGEGFLLAFDSVSKSLFMGDGEEYHARKGKDVHEIKLPELDKMDPDGMKWLMEEWVEQNPLMAAMIESLPKVVEDAKPRLAVDLLSKKEKPKLLIKRNHRHNKGKRL